HDHSSDVFTKLLCIPFTYSCFHHSCCTSFFFQTYYAHRDLHSFPTRRSSDLNEKLPKVLQIIDTITSRDRNDYQLLWHLGPDVRSEEHTSELQSRFDLVCRLLLEKKK